VVTELSYTIEIMRAAVFMDAETDVSVLRSVYLLLFCSSLLFFSMVPTACCVAEAFGVWCLLGLRWDGSLMWPDEEVR